MAVPQFTYKKAQEFSPAQLEPRHLGMALLRQPKSIVDSDGASIELKPA